MHTVLWRIAPRTKFPLKGVSLRIQPRLSVTSEAYQDLDTVTFDV